MRSTVTSTSVYTHKHPIRLYIYTHTNTHSDDNNIFTHTHVLKYLGAQLLGIFHRVQMTGPEKRFKTHRNKIHIVRKHLCKFTLNAANPV
jgi:hypothetical protein